MNNICVASHASPTVSPFTSEMLFFAVSVSMSLLCRPAAPVSISPCAHSAFPLSDSTTNSQTCRIASRTNCGIPSCVMLANSVRESMTCGHASPVSSPVSSKIVVVSLASSIHSLTASAWTSLMPTCTRTLVKLSLGMHIGSHLSRSHSTVVRCTMSRRIMR